MYEEIRIAGIVNDSITDGPGLRLTIFVQGCPFHCNGCHNPEAKDPFGGTFYTTESLFHMVRKNPLLTGVTLSGGEPMMQAGALLPFAKKVKEAGLDLAVYSGYQFEQILERGDGDMLALLRYADTMIDGPFIMEERNLAIPFKGSENQRILDTKKSLEQRRAVPTTDCGWVREEELQKFA